MSALGLALTLALTGCGSGTATSTGSSSSSAAESGAPSSSSSASISEQGDRSLEEFGETAWGLYEEARQKMDEFLDHRENAEPVHSKLGDVAPATENLAVGVIAVEEGPYDYRDETATAKVTVTMVNLSDKTVTVKASNWDADTSKGTRINHKLRVVGKNGKATAKSFTYARISPKAIYTDDVYFDGGAKGIKSIIYEPHWLVSAENEYLYWDL